MCVGGGGGEVVVVLQLTVTGDEADGEGDER